MTRQTRDDGIDNGPNGNGGNGNGSASPAVGAMNLLIFAILDGI